MFASSDFLERLSSAAAVPGGGSVAAMETAMGAALLVMVANLTIGRKKYAHVERQVEAILREASELRDRAAALAEEDVAAYGKVSAALAMPRSNDEERSERFDALQRALVGAAAPPLETMRCAAATILLAHRLVRVGNTSAISDVGTAALAARSGYHAARLNVEINLAAIRDSTTIAGIRSEMTLILNPDQPEHDVMTVVEAAIRGESG